MAHVKDLFDLTGNIAVVTGGSRGLGLEMAEAFGEAGAAVAITARREQWLHEAERHLRGRGIDCAALVCDVSESDQVDRAVTNVVDRFGRIDILVNNAGISWGEPMETMPLAKWHAVMNVNATGCFLMSRAVGPHMIKAGAGAIVNISSVAGLVGTDPDVLDAAGYSASKGAIVSLTRDLAIKWARHGIRVNAIAPGFFSTRLTTGVLERSGPEIERATPMKRAGRPEELKGAALFLASAASSYITGHVLVVDGGMTAW